MHHRIDWIDSAKAIGIFFVIMGHHKHPLYNYIYSFHMPLFFFLSGLLFPNSTGLSFAVFARKKALSLLAPYFFFSSALFLVWLVLGKFISPEVLQGYSITKNFLGIFYAQGQLEYMRWGVELWFLPCLYICTLMFYWVARLSGLQQLLTVTLAAVIGLSLPKILELRLPWSFDVALVALGFFWLGYKLKDKIYQFDISLKTAPYWLIFGLLNIGFFYLSERRIDMYQALYGNYAYFYLSAVSGILFYVLLAKIIPTNKFVLFVGANSIILYMLHMRALTVINFITGKLLNVSLPDHALSLALVTTLLQILILVPVILVINRYFPFVLGQTKRKQK
ncbi:Fucose 4-O-acetylase [Alteromonadaceae bacterium Bs31]|nr:Fucose 4-O-acetylase [Alteromonadaceae bacterium Bs31]